MRNPKQVPKNEDNRSLIAFTTLSPLSVGGVIGLLFVRGAQARPGLDLAGSVIFIIGLFALIFSLLHLGRPWKAPLAVLHFGSSWLSREVILFSLYLLMLFGYIILPVFSVQANIIFFTGIICSLFGLLSTFATGKIYYLRARPSWNHWSAILAFPLSALSTGVLFGLFVEQFTFGLPTINNSILNFILLSLASTLIIVIFRVTSLRQHSPEAMASRSLVAGSYFVLTIIRVAAILIAMSMVWISNSSVMYAWIPALIGDFVDRMLFFNTVVPVTLVGRYT